MSIPCIVSANGTYTMFVRGEPLTFHSNHKFYDEMKKAYSEGNEDRLLELHSPVKVLIDYVSPTGQTEIKGGQLVFNGRVVHSVLVDRILQMQQEGQPFEFMVKFLENLYQNPSKRAIDELYSFLSHHGIPINENGCFLGYKRVTQSYKDCHTGRVDNSIGQTVNMPRNCVDDNYGVACSEGFHVGSIEYVRNFQTGGKIVIVEVNPKDVVSVPPNEINKLRTCCYKVVCDFKGTLESSVCNSDDPYLEDDDCEYAEEVDDYEDIY